MALKLLPKSFLGIDIGTSSIKIVELSAFAGKIKLENYAKLPIQPFQQRQSLAPEKSTIFLPGKEIAEAIKEILNEAKIKTKNCVIAIPDFLTFFTTFSLPQMSKEELPEAVKIEARKYIPLPIKEVTVDWQIIEKSSALEKEKQFTILCVAVPNDVVYKYRQIALWSDLKLLVLEAEIFGLVRAITKKEDRLTGLIDMGAKTTTCSIVENGLLKVYHSLNFSGNSLTEKIARELAIEWELAEKIKNYWGISHLPPSWQPEMKAAFNQMLLSSMEPILEEMNKIFKQPYLKENKEIDKIILAGGIGLMPGILSFFQNYFKKEVELANPFLNISYLPLLEEKIKKMGPTFAVAVGMALRGLMG